LITIVDELRHLDGIKGNFMLSESEYLAPVALFEKGKIASQIIYSNVKEILDQHQYIFDTLWEKALSAEQRIREIEEGIEHYQTRFLEKPEEVTKELKHRIDAIGSGEWSICSTSYGLQRIYDDFYMQKRALDNCTINGTKWIGSIDKDNVGLVRILLGLGMKIKHTKNMSPMNFAVSPKEMFATIDEMKCGQMAKSLLISNEPLYVKHFNFIFEELWKNGVNVEDRIRQIEEGIDQSNIEIIQNPEESIKRSHELIRSAKEEVLRIFSSVNAFRRQVRLGIMHLFKEIVEKHGIKVRILLPATDDQQTMQIVNEETAALGLLPHKITIKSVDKSTQTSIGILVVDRNESLIVETKDDTKGDPYDAAGLAVYSNSKPIAVSYASIFESLWKQSELYEQLKMHDRMQREFINIAAHELRTPIQPILSLTQILQHGIKDSHQLQLMDIIIRNAKRLQRLTEDILDVTKIESHSLHLNKEKFKMHEMILNSIADCKNQLKKGNDIKLELACDDIFVEADRERLNQVIMNLLSNAMKFNQEDGTITIRTQIVDNQIIVRIKDTGIGIDPEIFPRLFTKFVTKAETGGTGLGLFISKAIIEAHGGRIWAENGSTSNNGNERRGAIFTFTMPLNKEQEQQSSLPPQQDMGQIDHL
ncbi:MAG TPA: HAMP domain-containing sensor histidine kinase, partial [Nitrososphaeraceae archaeon]|nr:HAMP domain-containing sensor histidine kinase [Nitrososphaeraceae archaeon]